jgi:glycerophosphoryl diester phosphodiesterase
MSRVAISLILLLLMVNGCDTEVQVLVPDYGAATILADTEAIPWRALDATEGVYEVAEGSSLLGRQVVIRHTRGVISIFGERDAVYCILESGAADSSLFFAGYWRKQVGTETGIMQISVRADEGGRTVLSGGQVVSGGVTLTGVFGNAVGSGKRSVRLVYRRPLYDSGKPFLILAHRAGGRNADFLPASENSAELVKLAEYFGANAVEIDVQLSKDGVPVVYHDEDMNLRLNQKSGLVGSISEYTLAQLESFVRLKNGERIPTLRRMLATILRQTSLKVVWLDIKPSVPLSMLTKIQQDYLDSARSMGRDLTIVIGIPDEEMAQELQKLPDYSRANILCELSVEMTRALDADVWAPRWTLGTQNDLVTEMQNEGRRVLTWTLDQAAYIDQFIRTGRFDGILTNYPALVAYYYYSQ